LPCRCPVFQTPAWYNQLVPFFFPIKDASILPVSV
jgi:hypothetical protein